nr:reverse transcriptase domain-containing protein [Tanacetum cinerariifolium]
MQTRSSSRLTRDQPSNQTSSTNTNPEGRNRRGSKQRVKKFNLEEHSPPVVTMTNQRTMAELLHAPTEGYAKAIVVPPILAEQFELKYSLINMMTTGQFFGLEKDNPHDHIRWFNKITSTIKHNDVPNSVIKLILFPFSLAGVACRWLEKEPSCSITTWEDLVSKFINEFFPPSRTTNLLNEILNFQQRFDKSFHEAWDRYKDLLRACPHHGFTKLNQLDTFYNALNPEDQDSLNVAAGGNLLERSTQDVLIIIKNKSKVRNSRSKPIVFQVKACDVNSNSEIAKLTHVVNQQTSDVTTAITAMLKQFQATSPPALVKAVEEIFVTCRGSGSLPSNTVANPKGELKAITTHSGLVIDGPTVPTPFQSINLELEERVEETFTDPNLAEYTIKVPPPPVQKYKPPPLLRTTRALVDVHGEDMILCDDDERLTLNMRHDTSSYSNQPQKESINLINVFNNSSEDFIEDLFPSQKSDNPTFLPHSELTSPKVNNDIFDLEGCNALSEKLPDLDSTKDHHPPLHDNPLSGSTTYFSNSLLEEFPDELLPEYDNNLQFDIESDLKEIEFLFYQDKDSNLKYLIDQENRANLAYIFVVSIPEMFTDEHALDYSSSLIFDKYDDDFWKLSLMLEMFMMILWTPRKRKSKSLNF